MSEEIKEKRNVFESMTANEEVYYSFIKNLLYVFSELKTIEEEYSNGLSRLLYFLKINDEDNKRFSALNIRDSIIHHLEQSKIFHDKISKDVSEQLFEKMNKLVENCMVSKIHYENEKIKNENFFNDIKSGYNSLKSNYNEKFTKIAKSYKDELEKKGNKDPDLMKKHQSQISDAKTSQDAWLKKICECSNQRDQYINEKQKIIYNYKRENKESLKELTLITQQFFSIYYQFYEKILNNLRESSKFIREIPPNANLENEIHNNEIKMFNENKESLFNDISEWDIPPKFDFVPFVSSSEQFFINNNINNSKGTQNMEILNKIRGWLTKTFEYKSPELYDPVPEIREQYTKIDEIAQKSMDGNSLEMDTSIVSANKDFILYYLKTLNKNRSKLINITERPYKSIEKIMNQCLDVLLEEQRRNQATPRDMLAPGEKIKFFEILEFIMILSQTFYCEHGQGKKKDFLQDDISKHKIWESQQLWVDLVDYHIGTEIAKKKIDNEKNLEEREKRYKSTARSTLITFIFNMKSFGLKNADDIKEICIKKYKLSPNDIPDFNQQFENTETPIPSGDSNIINNDAPNPIG